MCLSPPSPPPYPPPPIEELDRDWRRITCPVMGALVKHRDIVPDLYGMIDKQQTYHALLFVGISEKVPDA